MISISDHPPNYESGHFHLLSLGAYVSLANVKAVYFTGHQQHGGTPPLAPPATEEIVKWVYWCVIIFYPALQIISGSTQVYMAASDVCGKSVTLPREVYSHECVSSLIICHFSHTSLVHQDHMEIMPISLWMVGYSQPQKTTFKHVYECSYYTTTTSFDNFPTQSTLMPTSSWIVY